MGHISISACLVLAPVRKPLGCASPLQSLIALIYEGKTGAGYLTVSPGMDNDRQGDGKIKNCGRTQNVGVYRSHGAQWCWSNNSRGIKEEQLSRDVTLWSYERDVRRQLRSTRIVHFVMYATTERVNEKSNGITKLARQDSSTARCRIRTKSGECQRVLCPAA